MRLKQIILSFTAGIVFLMPLAPTSTAFANAMIDEGLSDADKARMHVVSSEGVFTFYEITTLGCDVPDENLNTDSLTNATKLDDSYKGKPVQNDDGFVSNMVNLGPSILNAMLQTMLVEMADLFAYDCGKKGSIGIYSQLLLPMKTVNVTLDKGIMKVAAIMQWIAFAFSLLIIVYYGVTMSSGIQQSPPAVFALRMFMSLLAVYLAPYLIQDILNINNYIVNNLSQLKVTIFDQQMPVATAFPVAMLALFQSILKLGTGFGFIVLLIMLVVVIVSLIPLLRLIVWWYLRWFRILIYTVISPLMFMAGALKETSKTTSKFIDTFVKEVFSQMFVVTGILLVSTILPTLINMITLYNLGIVGVGISLYASLTFLAQLPSIANSLIRGNAEGFQLRELGGLVETASKRWNRTLNSSVRNTGRKASSGARTAGKSVVERKSNRTPSKSVSTRTTRTRRK